MADEPRRSGRATKGQHTKNDTPEPAQKKGKGRKKAQKEDPEPELEEEATSEIIRCVCGYVVEDPRDKRAMICCDSCNAWQHNVHMGISEDDDETPENYFCEQCKPENHKELLEAVERGEGIWETREADAKAAKLAARKKGKGGRKSAVIEKESISISVGSSSIPSSTPQPDAKQETGNKRKLPPDAPPDGHPAENGSNKMRKVSAQKPLARQAPTTAVTDTTRRESLSAGTTLQTELVENIEDLNEKARKGAATGLLKAFTDAANDATNTGSFKVPAGQDVNIFAKKLALNVEYALYMTLWSRGAQAQAEYGTQCRAIMHNVKQNTELKDKILNNHVSPLALSKMTSEDMQSRQMQQKTAEWKKQIEKQSTFTSDPHQSIRRDRRGEETLENVPSSDYASSGALLPVRRTSTEAADVDETPHSAVPGSPRAVELPPDINKRRPSVDIRKLSIDTKRRTSSGQASARKSSATFDVDRVWSSVESPSTPARMNSSRSHRPNPSFSQADPDIDRLLKDENDEEEEYSPADYTPDPDTIWGGSVIMATVADFRATAKYAAGANLSQAYPWSQLMPQLLNIEGRIDVERAEAYLCGLQFSKTKDLTVVSVVPADHEEDKNSFDKLFEYFTTRKRYGVIRKSPIEQARDIYVIPLEAGSGNLPSFLELLQETALGQFRNSRTLLIAYVVNCTAEGQASTPQFAGSVGTNSHNTQGLGQNPSQRTPSLSQHRSPVTTVSTPHQVPYTNIPPNPYAQSPSSVQQKFSHSNQPSPAYPPQYQMSQHNGSGGGSLTGMAAAIHILGDLANSRSISELLQSSPQAGVTEFSHIKDVFLADPRTRESLDLLLPRLQAKIKGEI